MKKFLLAFKHFFVHDWGEYSEVRAEKWHKTYGGLKIKNSDYIRNCQYRRCKICKLRQTRYL